MKLNVSHLISTYVQIRRILRVSVPIELLAVDLQLLSLLSMDLHVGEINQLVIIKNFPAAGPIEYESDPSSDIDKNYFSDQESLTG